MHVKIEGADIDLVIWKWRKSDFAVPLRVPLPDAIAQVRLRPSTRSSYNRQFIMNCDIDIEIFKPPADFLDGLRNGSGNAADAAAARIHHLYRECLELLTAFTQIRRRSQSPGVRFSSLDDLFSGLSAKKVSWSIDGRTFVPFQYSLKKRNRLNPLFLSKNLIRPSDWKALQRAISKGPAPSAEVRELARLRMLPYWGEKRVPILESMAIIEEVIKTHVNETLKSKGLSNTRLQGLQDRLELAVLLNFLLPLTLNNSTYLRLKATIDSIDKMRKIRNKIVHENLAEHLISREEAYTGIDASMTLVAFIDRLHH